MKKEPVALVKCPSYEQAEVSLAVKNAIDLLGGLDNFVKPGQKVALKVNLLMKATPDRAMTSHPTVVFAVAQLVKKVGGIPFIVDSAGGPFTSGYMNNIYSASGMEIVAKDLEICLNQDFSFREVENSNAKVGLKFPIVKAIDEADVIINISKLKTHSFTGYTNAVKNMFGVVPGLSKVEMHGKYRDLNTFSDFLIDIHTYLGDKLVLNITDAVVGMEGFGPSNGSPKQIGAILASTNAFNLDAVACKLITINPNQTPILKKAIERGFWSGEMPEVLGEDWETMVVKDYQTVEPNNAKPYANYIPKFLQGTVQRVMTKRPYIPKNQCRGCGKCCQHCPAKAITMEQKKDAKTYAKIDYAKCIRCFCCQELCPFGVVKVKSGLIYKLIHHNK